MATPRSRQAARFRARRRRAQQRARRLALLTVIGALALVTLLLTAFGSDRTVVSPVNGPQSYLPLFVWKLIRVPNETQNARAWTGAFVLVLFVLVLFTTARFVSNRGQRKLGRSV